MSIFAVCGCALLAAVLILLLREWRSSLALPLRVAGALVLFLAAFSLFTPITVRISELFSVAGNSAVAPILFRALGIALVAEFTASLCRDLGESTLSATRGISPPLCMMSEAFCRKAPSFPPGWRCSASWRSCCWRSHLWTTSSRLQRS